MNVSKSIRAIQGNIGLVMENIKDALRRLDALERDVQALKDRGGTWQANALEDIRNGDLGEDG